MNSQKIAKNRRKINRHWKIAPFAPPNHPPKPPPSSLLFALIFRAVVTCIQLTQTWDQRWRVDRNGGKWRRKSKWWTEKAGWGGGGGHVSGFTRILRKRSMGYEKIAVSEMYQVALMVTKKNYKIPHTMANTSETV